MAAASGHDQQRGGVREVRAGVDLNAVTGYAPAPAASWRDGDAWLGGGTWLFSQPQPRLRRLLDLHAFGWPPLTETDDGLSIAATCTLAQLARWRPARPSRAPAAELARQCCDALLGSFKVQNVGHRGREHLPVAAGRADDLADRRARRGRRDRPAGRRRPPARGRGPGDRRRRERAGPGRAAHPGRPPGRRADRADRVPPGLAVGRRPVGRPRHRPPLPRRSTAPPARR